MNRTFQPSSIGWTISNLNQNRTGACAQKSRGGRRVVCVAQSIMEKKNVSRLNQQWELILDYVENNGQVWQSKDDERRP